MADLCKATIIGRLGSDPESRYTQDGRPVTRLRVAVNTNRKDREGNWQEQTQWFGVTAFGRQAEFAAERLAKGSRVYVEGRLESRTYEGQNGRAFAMDIVANEVVALESRQRAEAELPAAPEAGPEASPSAGRAAARRGGSPEESTELEDLPF